MGLRNITYQEDYRSGYNHILQDFFHPSLEESKEYWRAVGYFSSSALEAFGSPLGNFIINGGKIRLITSVELPQKDIDAIKKGLDKRQVYEQRLGEIIAEDFLDGFGDGISRLIKLLQLGRLEIRIAIPKEGNGIYHEKVGIFFDDTDFVAFSGSTNESITAFQENYECLDVYPSWELQQRAERKRRHFEQLWNNQDIGAITISFPDALKKQLIRSYELAKPPIPNSETKLNLKWRHQDEAVMSFLRAERGILDMATGTGKTRTALKIIRVLFEQNTIDTVIVSTAGEDLLSQWYEQILHLRKELNRRVMIYRHDGNNKDLPSFHLMPKDAILLVSRSFVDKALRPFQSHHMSRMLLIHDEVHGLGSPSIREKLTGLSDAVRYRLGLSATPEREYDAEGTAFIEHHIGPVLMTFGLKEAIERGILAPFNYYALPYQISDEDRQRIAKVYAKQSMRKAAGDPMSPQDVWIEISKVYKTSRMKIPVFESFIQENTHLLSRCIIFVETQEYGRELLPIIHRYRADFHTYFAGEESGTLQRFAQGDLDCIITCHRLSEGIDIRSLKTVILFASARARLETIQRIGRCLRINPQDPNKIANIVDFIRENDDVDNKNSDEDRYEWLMELSGYRCKELE